MDEKTLNSILDGLPFAFAYHQMIYDDQGTPVDYQFLEVNRAFEEIVSLKKADIIGRRVTQIIPDIREDPANWIAVYENVVCEQKTIHFMQYSKPLEKWFHVYALSPEKERFVTVFMDVTKTVEEQYEQTELFRALNDVILELDENMNILKILMSPNTPLPFPPELVPSSNEQLIGMSALVFLQQEEPEVFRQAFERVKQSGNPAVYSQHMILMGEDAWYQLMIKNIMIHDQRRYIVSIINVTEQKKLEMKLMENEALFQTVFEQAPIGISITNKGANLYSAVTPGSNINRMYMNILGRTREELAELYWTDITHPDDLDADMEQFEQLLAEKIDHYAMEKRYIWPDGSIVWVNLIASTLKNKDNHNISHLCLLEDITKRKLLEQSLRESERSKSVLLSHLPGLAYRCLNDVEWTMKFVSDGCYDLTGYKPESLLDNHQLSFNDLISNEYRDLLSKEWERVIALKTDFRYEYEIITATGEKKWVLEMGQPIFNESGQVEALEGVIFDISEQRSREQQILYMNQHDDLTTLYNRKFFDEECKRHNLEHTFPLTFVQCDLDGLRLINDAFGFQEGNALLSKVANILKGNSNVDYILARTGDDDFSLLMPGAGAAEDFIRRITDCIDVENASPEHLYTASLSFGYSTRRTPSEEVDETLKAARDSLNNRKILNVQSSHSAILTSIMTTLHARSEETEEHAQRLFELSERIGRQLGISQKSMTELELFSKLHDIGKIGIRDSILNKPEMLTDAEWSVMKKHPEIGYRIAMSLPDLKHVAEDILSHHERWDGTGYPRGLRGDAIPLLARILAVADAFDAMTKDRVYRKAMKQEEALEEIRRNRGTQFDPSIAQLFLNNFHS